MNFKNSSPLRSKELIGSVLPNNKKNEDFNNEEMSFADDIEIPEEIVSNVNIGTNLQIDSKELILLKNSEREEKHEKIGHQKNEKFLSNKILKMYDTYGLDKIDESRASPLKIFKYLSKPAENSLYEMDLTLNLEANFDFIESHPLLKEIYECILKEEEYVNKIPDKILDDTYELLNHEEICYKNSFNVLGVFFLLKNLMDTYEVNLSIENNFNLFSGIIESSQQISFILSSSQKSNPYFVNCPKILTLYHMHLLSSNFNDSIFVLRFNEDNFHSFSELKNDKALLNLFTKNLKEVIEETLNKHFSMQFFERKMLVIFTKLSKSKNLLLIEMHLPFLQKGFIFDVIDGLNDALAIKYKESFNQVTTHKIFRYCHTKVDDIDLWGYKEFKDSLFSQESERGGFPYLKPRGGWFRFGLNVTNFYQTDCETDWFGSQGGPKEWAVCYCNVGLNSKLSVIEREVYKDIYSAYEEGSSQKEKCGFGILATFDFAWLEGSLEGSKGSSSLATKSWKSDEKGMDFLKIQGFDFMDAEFKKYEYSIALQCRVNPKKIRFPEKFGKKLFIVNDPKDIRPYGLLIRQLE